MYACTSQVIMKHNTLCYMHDDAFSNSEYYASFNLFQNKIKIINNHLVTVQGYTIVLRVLF